MDFQELTEITCYSPVTLAQAVLYGTGSRRVRQQIKRLGYAVTEPERKMLVQVAIGKKQAFYDFFSSTSGAGDHDKPDSSQVPDSNQSSPVSEAA